MVRSIFGSTLSSWLTSSFTPFTNCALLDSDALSDAAFAPVAFRFQTYAVKPEGAAGEYLATLLANPHMQEWAAAARAETESIPEEDLYG